jgi:transcriptional regulator GlxA family with amidase domain
LCHHGVTTVPSVERTHLNLLALPQSSGSVLYGLYDVLGSVGRTWSDLTGEPESHPGFDVQIVAPARGPFCCHAGVPVAPHAGIGDTAKAEVIVVSDLAVDADADPRGMWPEVAAWLAARHAEGAVVCSVCTGSVLLAEAGLLDRRDATSHWAAARIFATYYPSVRLRLEDVLVVHPDQRLITSGGAASWEDLVLYLIERFCGRQEAVRTAKIFLLGDRSEGQLPYVTMQRSRRHRDGTIAECQTWIAHHYEAANPVALMVARSGLPARTFKRRFRAATGQTPVGYVQALRIEEAKQQLETTSLPADEIAVAVGYEDPAFFRRLFKRHTGITPGRYRRRFGPAAGSPSASGFRSGSMSHVPRGGA